MVAQSEITPRSVLVLAAAFVSAAVSGFLVASTAITIFMDPISRDFAWSRAEIGGALSLLFLGMGVGAPVFGRVADRLGPRQVLLPLTILSGLLLSAFSIIGKSLSLFYAAYFALGVVTPGAVAYSKLISAWFFHRRGIALTAIGAGTALGSVTVPQVANLLLHQMGWQKAYLAFGIVELLVAFPILFFFFRERPTAMGAAGLVSNEVRPDGAPFIGMLEAFRSRTYWLLVAALMAGVFAQLGVTTHAIGILSEHGLDLTAATLGVSILAFGGFAASFATGFLLDRYDTPRVIAPFALLSLAGLALLFVSHKPIPVFAALLLFGFGVGGLTSAISYFTSRYFGVRNFSSIYGLIMPILLLLSAPAPAVVGAIFDETGSYGLALLVTGGVLLASLGLLMALPPYPFPVKAESETLEPSSKARAPVR